MPPCISAYSTSLIEYPSTIPSQTNWQRGYCTHGNRVIKDEAHVLPSSMSFLRFTPRTGSASMKALSFSASATLSFAVTPALGTRSAMASPQLVIVKLLPVLTSRSNSGSFVFASCEPISIFMTCPYYASFLQTSMETSLLKINDSG